MIERVSHIWIGFYFSGAGDWASRLFTSTQNKKKREWDLQNRSFLDESIFVISSRKLLLIIHKSTYNNTG